MNICCRVTFQVYIHKYMYIFEYIYIYRFSKMVAIRYTHVSVCSLYIYILLWRHIRENSKDKKVDIQIGRLM